MDIGISLSCEGWGHYKKIDFQKAEAIFSGKSGREGVPKKLE